MKKIIFFFFLSALPLCVNAQKVFNLVIQSADRTISDPNSSYAMTQMAQFKKTALVYLRNKAFETQPEVKEAFLDEQEYYLSEFISLYVNELLKTKELTKKEQKEKVKMFMQASSSNPLFNDTNTEVSESFIISGNELTPFSLDTDWEKAFAAAKANS